MRTLLLVSLALLGIAPGLSARELMNVWHIPGNEEPPTVTMRNPVLPDSAVAAVYMYVGGWPSGTIWTATLHYRQDGGAWTTLDFAWDSVQPNDNEYFITNISGPLPNGTLYEYYIETTNPSFDTTYVFGTDQTTNSTLDEATAMAAPFAFLVGSPGTPTPTPTPTPPRTNTPSFTMTPTPTPTIEATITGTPILDSIAVTIFTDRQVYRGGDLFRLLLNIHSPGPGMEVDQYVVLAMGGEYWYWPSWRVAPPDFTTRLIQPRHDYEDVLLSFPWPYGVGAVSGITFYGALTSAGGMELLDWDAWECAAE
ncbi:hypothetical protein JW905_12145 [bacterium]|nr:hypothetical protein [candidate division CSSED10-310 bacterium]